MFIYWKSITIAVCAFAVLMWIVNRSGLRASAKCLNCKFVIYFTMIVKTSTVLHLASKGSNYIHNVAKRNPTGNNCKACYLPVMKWLYC